MAILMRARLALATFLLGAALLGASVSGCLQADSRGDESPDEVHVGTPPQWDNGIRKLMAAKCAVCHQVPHPAVAPSRTPDDFDLRYQVSSPGGLDGAQSILDAIDDGILRGDVDEDEQQMPPPFATPLTTAERDALELWSSSGGP